MRDRTTLILVFLVFFLVPMLDASATYYAVTRLGCIEENHPLVNEVLAWAFVVASLQGIVFGGMAVTALAVIKEKLEHLIPLAYVATSLVWLGLFLDRWSDSIRIITGMPC